jgi:hypothetical protein
VSATQVRGLCSRCYEQRDVRALYPDGRSAPRDHDVSEAELEAVIADQMARLPAWWEKEVERQRAKGVNAARLEFGRLIWGKRA